MKISCFMHFTRTLSETVLTNEEEKSVASHAAALVAELSGHNKQIDVDKQSATILEQDKPEHHTQQINLVEEQMPSKAKEAIVDIEKGLSTSKKQDEVASIKTKMEQKSKQKVVNNVEEAAKKSFEEELKNSVSIEETQKVFEQVATAGNPKKSLNDVLVNSLHVGLNDRIAFVKHLFENNQADYNRVISQLNTFETEDDALRFLNKQVKPDYNWEGKELFEERLIQIITRKFA